MPTSTRSAASEDPARFGEGLAGVGKAAAEGTADGAEEVGVATGGAAVVGVLRVDVGEELGTADETARPGGFGDAVQLESTSPAQMVMGTSHHLAWLDVARLAWLRISIWAA